MKSAPARARLSPLSTLELETDEADRLAHELSRLTGESVTAVVTKALAERLACERAAREGAARVKAFAQRIRPDYDTRPSPRRSGMWRATTKARAHAHCRFIGCRRNDAGRAGRRCARRASCC